MRATSLTLPISKDLRPTSHNRKASNQPTTTRYKSKYNEIYRGLPAEVRLQIWKYLLPPNPVFIKRISFRAGDPQPNNDGGARATRSKNRSEDPMYLQCSLRGGSNIAILALDRLTRTEILPLYRLNVHLRKIGVLERVAFLNNSHAKASHLVMELCLGRIVPYCVAPYHIQSFEFARFLVSGEIGVFRHVRILRVELHVKDLGRVRLRLVDIVGWARRHRDGDERRDGSRRELKFVIVDVDRQDDGLDDFESELVEAAEWAGSHCKID